MTTTNSRIKDAIITDLKQRINDLQKEKIEGQRAIEKLKTIEIVFYSDIDEWDTLGEISKILAEDN